MKIAVLLPVRRAQSTLRATLDSLLQQISLLDAEILVAVSELDPTYGMVRNLVPHPQIRTLIVPGRRSIPQLRGDALALANADYVVITEDHCTFPPGWLNRLVEASQGAVVSGGGVLNGRESWVGWAQYFTRYWAFQPPLPEGPAQHLPGNNACYPRTVLDRYGHLLLQGFWEADFNAALRKTESLCVVAGCDVIQHQQRGILEYIPLRFRHGRCYGARREDKRLARVPVVPAVLFLRAARTVFAKKQRRIHFLFASPLLLVYFCAWAAGEAWGYIFGAGDSCSGSD